MSSKATENLFLLEFLVDSLDLAPQCECASPPGETCVAFKFLDNAPLEICEADFCPGIKYGEEQSSRLKSGKSCLFSLTAEQVKTLMSKFDVEVSVIRKMQPGWLPEKLDVGSALISIANLFKDMIQSIQEPSAPEGPTSKTLKDVFIIISNEGMQVGKIGVYIRMSCFGKLIVTQFQMNFEDKSVLFKDKEGKSLYRYKKAPKGKEHKIDDVGEGQDICPFRPQPQQTSPCPPSCPNAVPPLPPCVECDQKSDAPCLGMDPSGQPCGLARNSGEFQPGGPGGVMPFQLTQSPMYNQQCPQVQCNVQIPSQMPPDMQQMQQMQQIQQMQMMAPCNECGMFPEAPCMVGQGGMMGGGYMGPYMQDYGTSALMQSQQMGQGPPAGKYQEIGATLGTNTLTIRVHKDNKIEPINEINEKVSGDSCQCCPGAVAERKKRKEASGLSSTGQPPQTGTTQAYNMGMGLADGNQRQPFTFKMGGSSGHQMSKNIVVNPPYSTTPDGTTFTEVSDKDKEVFILRIGKKSEGLDKKNNLELELCTPKGPEYKPAPQMETREVQYEETDAEGTAKGGKGRKGKGGKGGKGGKKGKKGKKK